MLFAQPSRKRKASTATGAKTAATADRQRSQAERRCRDERVDRALSDRFSDFPLAVQDHREVSGQTLRQAVASLLFPSEKTNQQAKRLSPTQVAQLRMQYATSDIAEFVLQEQAGDGPPLSRRYQDAIMWATHKQSNRRDRGPLSALLRSTAPVGMREVKAVLRVCTPLRASANQDILTFVLTVMKWLVHHKVHLRHERLVACLRRTWDEALTALYGLAQRVDEGVFAFHTKFEQLLDLCTSKGQDIRDLLAVRASGQFSDHLVALRAVTEDSKARPRRARPRRPRWPTRAFAPQPR